MAGPLPGKNTRRRNAPTIPTTNLPAGGRKGAAPKCPYALGKAGKAWWAWAWKLPQAAAWDKGALYVIGRRAQLEDDIAALEMFDDFVLSELLGESYNDMSRSLSDVLGRLKGMASGRSVLMREMREIDDRLGLTPKSLAALRWTITDDDAAPSKPAPTSTKAPSNVRRLRAVDPLAAAG